MAAGNGIVILRAGAAFLLVFIAPFLVKAVEPANVLVLYNSASPEGAQIADYYRQVHPGVHTLALTGVSSAEEITHSEYLSTIRPQVVSGLQGLESAPGTTIDVIVTTKGLPLRIQTTQNFASYPASYSDPQGNLHNVYSSSWRQYSSLESELTRVDTFSTWKQMLDQTWWDPLLPSAARNPYYNAGTPFDHANPAFGGIRLTSRLDGFTVADVTGSIDRAQRALTGPYGFVLDDDPSKTYDRMPELVSQVLAPRGVPYLYDNTSTFVGDFQGPVIGYVGHGTNQSSTPPGYILDSTSGLQFDLASGAVFHTWESFNAHSFSSTSSYSGQGLVAEWLARGGTAGVGQVEEPGANVNNVANEDTMFQMLLDGYTWVEAAWGATNQLSFVNTVVGDPLMVWRPLTPGDADMDGRVGSSDLASLSANWGRQGTGGGSMWGMGDFNGDGRVGSEDLAYIAANWGMLSAWAAPGAGADITSGAASAAGSDHVVPEPAAFLLGGLGMIGLLASCSRRRRVA